MIASSGNHNPSDLRIMSAYNEWWGCGWRWRGGVGGGDDGGEGIVGEGGGGILLKIPTIEARQFGKLLMNLK